MSGGRVIDGYCTPGTERETCLSASALLAQMDAAGVSAAVIAPQDREIAVDNRGGNARVLSMAEAHPGRFIPACCANPWFGDAAIGTLREAAERGARLLVLAPALQGFMPTDELVDPLIAEADSLGVAVYVHTGPHSNGSPAQVFHLATRHAGTRFVLGHGGSTDYAMDLSPVMEAKLGNLWFELSFVRPWGMPALGRVADVSKLIFGSGSPRNELAWELQCFDAHWPRSQHPQTYGSNLLAALGLSEPADGGCDGH